MPMNHTSLLMMSPRWPLRRVLTETVLIALTPIVFLTEKRRALLLQIEQKELCMYYSKIPLLHPINKRKIN